MEKMSIKINTRKDLEVRLEWLKFNFDISKEFYLALFQQHIAILTAILVVYVALLQFLQRILIILRVIKYEEKVRIRYG
jgi:hypothetical protein